MKFKKISDNTIRCTITAEEMSKHDINLDDLLDNREKAETFLRFILEEAKEELNFTTSTDALSVQLSVMPGGDVSMMISDGKANSLHDMIDQLKDTLSGMDVEDLLPGIGKKVDDVISGQNKGNEFLHGKDAAKQKARRSADIDLAKDVPSREDIAIQRAGEALANNRSELIQQLDRPLWAEFTSLDQAIRFAKHLDVEAHIPAQLYQRYDEFFLRMNFADMIEEVSKAVLTIAEYAESMYAEDQTVYGFIEHADKIMDKDAIEVLKSL